MLADTLQGRRHKLHRPTRGLLGQPLRTLGRGWWVTLHPLRKRRVFMVLGAGREKGKVLK